MKPPAGVHPDLARAEELARERGARAVVRLLAETPSTNDEAKRAAREGAPNLTVFVAETQSAGRGRQGRAWSSPRGENLLFSVLFRLTGPTQRLPLAALAAGLAVRDVVARALPRRAVRVKWPNDVLVARDGDGALGRKVAGVLVESVLSGAEAVAIVGVGLNVHTRAFPDDLAARATSVALELDPADAPPDRAALLADAIAALDRDVPLVVARGLGLVHARLAEADALRGRPVRSDDGVAGIAEGVDADGRLLVRGADGVLRRLVAGEVHLV